jgi:hypothetical protein
MESQFAREQRWRDQQDRLSREENKTDSGIPLGALPSVRTSRLPGLEVDELSRDFLERFSREQLIELVQETYLGFNRLRRQLEQLRASVAEPQPEH